jgi:hypothetical protein
MHRLTWAAAIAGYLGLPVDGTKQADGDRAWVQHEKGVIFGLQQRAVPAATSTPFRPTHHSQAHLLKKMPY